MMPLIDSFRREHKYLRISVTDRCNLRCSYCQPADGVLAGMPPQGIKLKERSEILSFDEIERAVKIFSSMGINKIRITGGEPLVRKDLPRLIQRLAIISGIETVGVTTNGVLLKSFAAQLRQAGVTNLNFSLDSLHQSRFEEISGQNYFNDVINGIEAALVAGFQPLKLNVVVMGGINDDELIDFIEFVRNKPINVRFIEYMPFKFNGWGKAIFVSYQEMIKKIEQRYKLIPLQTNISSNTKDYWIDGVVGTISFITPMSDHFCGTCNRIRLTADGLIKSCLFHPAEINLRSALRNGETDDTIKEMIYSALKQKQYTHPVLEALAGIENQSMAEIGG